MIIPKKSYVRMLLTSHCENDWINRRSQLRLALSKCDLFAHKSNGQLVLLCGDTYYLVMKSEPLGTKSLKNPRRGVKRCVTIGTE